MNTLHNENRTRVEGPTKAFRIAALATLLIGSLSYCIGLVNADMMLNEKGYYLISLLFGLFSAVSVQKSVRDNAEGIKTSKIYHILAWIAAGSAIALLCIGLYNAELLLSEKGFFGMAYTLSLFAAITVQKNVRDTQSFNSYDKKSSSFSKAKSTSSKKASDLATKRGSGQLETEQQENSGSSVHN